MGSESAYLEDHSRNWREWRESLKRVLEETGHRFRWAELERPIGGFRRARVHVTDESGIAMTLTWFQPWCGDRIESIEISLRSRGPGFCGLIARYIANWGFRPSADPPKFHRV